MDDLTRRQYLEAMGIDVWRSRAADLGAQSGGAAPEVAPAPTAPAAEQAAPAAAAPEHPAPPAGQPGAPAAATTPTAPRTTAMAHAPAAPSAPAEQAAPPADDEPPPWSDADLAGLPADDGDGPASTDDAPGAAERPDVDPVAAMGWPALEQAVAGCRACGLCERRTNTVFGVGDRNAAVMFIGEGPGADEDRQGEPFVGRAGQLLNRMLAAAGFTRQQVYIANIVKCRPPNNRDPSVDEAAACRAYLARQIALVQPRLIVCLGRVPAHNLLGTTESIGRLRGRLHQYGPARVPLLVTYHPSYYLRSPQEKAKGWQDLQRMLAFLE